MQKHYLDTIKNNPYLKETLLKGREGAPIEPDPYYSTQNNRELNVGLLRSLTKRQVEAKMKSNIEAAKAAIEQEDWLSSIQYVTEAKDAFNQARAFGSRGLANSISKGPIIKEFNELNDTLDKEIPRLYIIQTVLFKRINFLEEKKIKHQFRKKIDCLLLKGYKRSTVLNDLKPLVEKYVGISWFNPVVYFTFNSFFLIGKTEYDHFSASSWYKLVATTATLPIQGPEFVKEITKENQGSVMTEVTHKEVTDFVHGGDISLPNDMVDRLFLAEITL